MGDGGLCGGCAEGALSEKRGDESWGCREQGEQGGGHNEVNDLGLEALPLDATAWLWIVYWDWVR